MAEKQSSDMSPSPPPLDILVENSPKMMMWMNPIPMECGVLSGGDRSTPRFTISLLKKLLVYARNKGKHAYPWLSYSVWQHIAKNKLNIPEEISWLYFETFDTISDVDVKDRLKLISLISKCSSKEELDRLHKQVCVDTVKFMLFLYIQNTHRLSLRAPLLTGEEWPSPEREPKSKSSSEQTHLTCVSGHLIDILQLVAEPGGDISRDGIRALEFLLLATRDKRQLVPLSTAIQYSDIYKCSETYTLPQVEGWIRSRLVLHPYGPHAMKGGTRDKKCCCFRSESVGRIVTNSQLSPQGSQSTLLHGINKQTLAKCGDELANNFVYIQNCKSSFIYLLAPMKCVVIEKCTSCVIVLGAVERSVVVTSCSGLCLLSACRRLQVGSSSHSVFHLLTATNPVLLANNHSLTFAPYNSCYPKLEQHLEKAGLTPHVNLWHQPLCITGEGGGEEGVAGIWCRINPEDFYKMEVPFKMDGPTKINPCLLPDEYKQALQERERRISSWHSSVKEAKLSLEKQQELQKAVQEKFKEWLEVTGNKREIYDLGRGASRTTASTLS